MLLFDVQASKKKESIGATNKVKSDLYEGLPDDLKSFITDYINRCLITGGKDMDYLSLTQEDKRRLRKKWLSNYSASEVLANYTPSEVLANYTPSEVLANYTPSEVLANYTPSEVLASYTPSEVLASYTPPEILSNITPDQIVAGLNAKQLKALSKLLGSINQH
ncbi:hypothetical protein MHK_004222 [Candidatus Magnetomorum sp. HK-1]|nr:hypothetical protein MHK_004222 [Candidatus Magnetomorum sp. HK-1]